jgi:hypothetical protein
VPPGRSGTVELPRGVFIALVAALLLCVAALAFFLGRESRGRVPAAATPEHIPAPHGAAPVAVPPDTTATDVETRAPSDSEPLAGGVPVAPASPAAPAVDARLRDEVARYFREVESIEASSKYWSDPMSLANSLLEQAAGGDASGLERLLAAQKGAAQRLRRVSVPAPCAEHHRLTVSLLDSAAALLQRLLGASANASGAGLGSLVNEGHDLEQRAKQVDTLAADIKKRYGIT